MEPIAHEVSAFLLIPFVLMLLSIAIGPVVAGHWWEKNINKLVVALVLGIPTAIILIAQGFGHELQHQIVFDYIPFVLLLGGLFTVTGGIRLSGDIRATPGVNTLFLPPLWGQLALPCCLFVLSLRRTNNVNIRCIRCFSSLRLLLTRAVC